jgi:hypothetical protein
MKNPRCLEAENAKLKAERDAAQKDRDALVEQRQQTELLWQGRLLEATGIATAALAEERIAFLELQLDGLQKAVERFVYKANFTPPWESAGAIWGEMCRVLNNALIDSKAVAEKPKQEAQIGDRPQDICALCYHPNDDVAHQRCLAERAALKRVEEPQKFEGEPCPRCSYSREKGHICTKCGFLR